MLIKAMDPVPQGLAIHAANPRRRLAILPVVNRCQRQQPSHLVGVLGLPSQTAQINRRKVIPKTNCCAHCVLPESNPEALNESQPAKNPESQSI